MLIGYSFFKRRAPCGRTSSCGGRERRKKGPQSTEDRRFATVARERWGAGRELQGAGRNGRQRTDEADKNGGVSGRSDGFRSATRPVGDRDATPARHGGDGVVKAARSRGRGPSGHAGRGRVRQPPARSIDRISGACRRARRHWRAPGQARRGPLRTSARPCWGGSAGRRGRPGRDARRFRGPARHAPRRGRCCGG